MATEQQTPQAALADLNQAIELDPADASAIARRGETYRRMERYDEALADLNRAIELEPDNAWAIQRRYYAYRRIGRYGKALADFKRYVQLRWAAGVVRLPSSRLSCGQRPVQVAIRALICWALTWA